MSASVQSLVETPFKLSHLRAQPDFRCQETSNFKTQRCPLRIHQWRGKIHPNICLGRSLRGYDTKAVENKRALGCHFIVIFPCAPRHWRMWW